VFVLLPVTLTLAAAAPVGSTSTSSTSTTSTTSAPTPRPRGHLPAATVHSAQPRFIDVPADQAPSLAETAAKVQGNFTARLLSASERFLGTPYRLDPLGEGPGAPDPDPLLRFDEVDCMTFVETTIALAQTGAPERTAIEARLTALRYADAKPAFENRHHFFTAQWVAALRDKGLLRDITRALAIDVQQPELAVRHVKGISQEQWKRRTSGRKFDLPEARVPLGGHPLTYVPIDRVNQLSRRIPSGSLFALVREDRPLSPFLVTHVGFVVQRDGKTWLRHAGRDLYGQVVDEAIEHYVQRAARYRKWRVLGLQFFELGEQQPH
jgi:hypothetical protein